MSNILELFKQLGSARAVRDVLLQQGVHTGSLRSMQRQLKLARESVAEPELSKPVATGVIQAPDKRRRSLSGHSVYVFTSAQNNTLVHEDLLASLLQYCDHRGAKLVVSKFTYNKSGFQNGTKEDQDVWYDPRLTEFLVDESCEIAKDLLFCGELDILPTAERPLQGFRNYTQNSSGIIPHAKMQMLSLPRVDQKLPPRFLYSTGAITQRNYIQRCAGQKAEFHHVYGAVVVEFNQAGEWFLRQLVASEDGSFYDLDKYFSPTKMLYCQPVETLVLGDIHAPYLDPKTKTAIDGMMASLKPERVFVHDLVDCRSVSHHDKNNRDVQQRKHNNQEASLEVEIRAAGNFLNWLTQRCELVHVVSSNHDDHITKFLNDPAGQFDTVNNRFWFHMNYLLQPLLLKPNILQFCLRQYALFDNQELLKFLTDKDSVVIHGVEHAIHGHRGINGAKGTPESFRSIGYKCSTGHTHSAGIVDGVYTVGTSSYLDLGYNSGPTSWSHSHCVMYKNGKRSIITNRGSSWKK